LDAGASTGWDRVSENPGLGDTLAFELVSSVSVQKLGGVAVVAIRVSECVADRYSRVDSWEVLEVILWAACGA